MFKAFIKHLYRFPLAYLLGIATFLRLVILVVYEGYSIFPDSNGYIELAELLSQFQLDGYSGKRTPGYPVIIALLYNNFKLVTVFQMLLGILNTYLLYSLITLETNSKPLALWFSLFFTSLLNVLFFEAAILTETLTLSLLLFSFWLIKKYDLFNKALALKHILLLSVLFGFSYLVRPMFIYAPIWFAIVYVYKNIRIDYRKALIKGSLVLIIPLIAFYSWASINEKNIGVFGSTYFMGINLAQTATPFFEKAPDEDALIRDIFVKHRDSVARYGTPHQYPMSVWSAYDELIEKTQLQPHELSTELGRISKNLFLEHPILYLKQAGISWIYFWDASFLWKPEQLRSPLIKNSFMGSWLYIQKWLCLLLNLLFILFSIKSIVLFFKGNAQHFSFELFIITTVLLGSFAQALITFGSNARFSFPYLPLIIYIVAINLKPYIKRYV